MRYSLNYVRCKKPRAVVLENVAGMVSRHPKVLEKIMRAFEKLGYNATWKCLNTLDFKVPQDRKRMILVAIRKDSQKRPFTWPEPTGETPNVRAILDPLTDTDKPFSLPDKNTTPRAFQLVRKAILTCKQKRISVKHSEVFVDVDCSEKFSVHGVNHVKCLTATRGASGGPWVVSRGRKVTLSEMYRLQGMDESDFEPATRKAAGCNARSLGHMLGNTVSLSVAEAVLNETLWASGLSARRHKGRWV